MIDHQQNWEIALMHITPLVITPLLVMTVLVSLFSAVVTIAATQCASRTTRLLAKRYPRLLSEDAVTRTDVSPSSLAISQ